MQRHSAEPNLSDRRYITCPSLPLAVYQELVTHLRQVPGVQADVLPQTSTEFSYEQSQIGGLWYAIPMDAELPVQERVEAILRHYGDRFGSWQTLTPPPTMQQP